MTNVVDLENDWLRAQILPGVGCKMQSLICKQTGRQILWQNPRVRARPYPIDANFDNYWSGGWDDGFPTCDACVYNGESYPNLGELRSLDWSIDTQERRRAAFSAYGPISPVRAEKEITLDPHQPVLRMRCRILNIGTLPLGFIWGTHPAFAVNPDTVLKIPAGTGIVGVASSPAFGEPGQVYRWPDLAGHDMSRALPASAGAYAGHYVTDLQAGWFAVEDRRSGEGVLLAFPADQCPNLWLWMCYGGWRGYSDVVVVEPWTSRPVNLEQAVAAGTHRVLEPGGKFEVEIRLTPYRGEGAFREALGLVGSI